MTYYTPATYVFLFPYDIRMGIQRAIRRKLRDRGYRNKRLDDHVANAMNSRIGDLDEMIDVNYWLKKANRR